MTDHLKPGKHSNPHDHIIDWSKNVPAPGSPINYNNTATPTFEEFISEIFNEIGEIIQGEEKSMKNYEYNPDDHKFETLGEFKCYLASGWNVGFEYNGVEYGIEGHDNKFAIWIYNKYDIAEDITLEEVLNFKLDGVKIRDLILKADIIERLA